MEKEEYMDGCYLIAEVKDRILENILENKLRINCV